MARRNQPVSVYLLLLFAIVVIVMINGTANASGDKITQSNDMNTASGNVVGGDALGLGFSSPSFGAAVAQCMGTTAKNFAFGAYGDQKLQVNWWCVGSSLYQLGEYRAAALSLCQRTELGELYPSVQECENDLSAPPERPVVEPEVIVEDSFEEDLHASQLEEQQMLIADMQSKLMNLESAVSRPAQTIIRETGLTEAQKAALREVKQ